MTACPNCQSEEFITKRIWVIDGKLDGMCDKCSDFAVTTIPDVFFKGAYKSEALGVEFTSRQQKADYLKAHDLREAGDERMDTKDWVTGSRDYRKKKFDKEDRPKLQKIIRDWRQRRG